MQVMHKFLIKGQIPIIPSHETTIHKSLTNSQPDIKGWYIYSLLKSNGKLPPDLNLVLHSMTVRVQGQHATLILLESQSS